MKFNRNNSIGLLVSVVLHLLLILVLWLVTVERPEQQEEGGVEVMMGFVEVASGDLSPMPGEPAVVEPQTESVPEVEEEPMVVQNDEPSVNVNTGNENKKKPEKPVKKEKTEEEIRLEREKAAAANANKLIAGAFGKGSSMTNSGKADTGNGVQGSVDGNSNTGETAGVGGYGSFNLSGRSLGTGSLPAPSYNVREEGTVVVNIWVNPKGRVIRTSINPKTNTSSSELRNAAEKAARLARFNEISSVDDQQGTITYVFNLK